MLTAEQSAAGAAGLLLAAAAAWLVLSEFPVVDPGKPTTGGGALVLLEASPITIDPFERFNVNPENPFIPSNLRSDEIQARASEKNPGKKQPVATKPETAEVPPPPTVRRLAVPGKSGPAVTGLLISRNGPQALLTFPGEDHATLMKPGETVNGWTLVEVSDSNVVRVKDVATGTVQALVVPDAQAPAAPPAEDKGKDAGKKPAVPGKADPQAAQAAAKAGQPPGEPPPAGKKRRKNKGGEGGGGEAPDMGEGAPPMQPAPPPADPALPPKPADKML